MSFYEKQQKSQSFFYGIATPKKIQKCSKRQSSIGSSNNRSLLRLQNLLIAKLEIGSFREIIEILTNFDKNFAIKLLKNEEFIVVLHAMDNKFDNSVFGLMMDLLDPENREKFLSLFKCWFRFPSLFNRILP